MQISLVDKLMTMSEQHADQIADSWYKALSTNSRTPAFASVSRDGCLRHAVNIYKNLTMMYSADDCYQAVQHILDVGGFAEDFYARGIPLEEVIYALVLLRRHIWLYADSQAIFSPSVLDMYNAVDSINRICLVFDYAFYIVTRKYEELSSRTGRNLGAGRIKTRS
jgi:hypothetical protein